MLNRVIVALISLLVMSTIIGCGNKNVEKKDMISNYDSYKIADIYDKSYGTSTLYKDSNDYKIYEVKEEEVVNTYESSTYTGTNKVLTIDENAEPDNSIVSSSGIIDNTWESDVSQSSKLINYMIADGYEIVRKVSTQDFIDYILIKNSATKRVLITKEYLVVTDVNYTSFKITDYIK